MDLFNVYKRWDIEPVKGLGSTLWDAAGQEYLDLYGGHAVISIGHSHPHYVAAIKDQIGKLGFYSNAVQNGLQDALAEKLGKVSGYDSFHLFLCNSGAEPTRTPSSWRPSTPAVPRSSPLAEPSTDGLPAR